MFGISSKYLANQLEQQTQKILAAINLKGNQIMGANPTSLSDVQASLDLLTSAQVKTGSEVVTAIADIQALNAQVASLQSAGGATPADLAALKTSIDSITTNLSGTATSLGAALPPPPPAAK